jgi:hypothetical protein
MQTTTGCRRRPSTTHIERLAISINNQALQR